MQAKLPQLRMRRDLLGLPELVVPAGYELRSLYPEDLVSWTRLLVENAELGDWSLERASPLFSPGGAVILEGSYFLTVDGRPVATAQLDLPSAPPIMGLAELGWVAVHPEHQGRGFGYVICLAVLRAAAERGFPGIFLNTDDWRLPAIRTYLNLGFAPWNLDETAPERWRAVEQRLAEYSTAPPPPERPR